MMERPKNTGRNFGQFLIEGAFIKLPDLQKAQEEAKRTGKKLQEALLALKLVSPETLPLIYSNFYGAQLIDLKQFDVQPEAVIMIPETMAREKNVLALTVSGNTLTVAMDDPGDTQLIEYLTQQSGKLIRPVIPLYGGIRAAIDVHYRLTSSEIEQQISRIIEAKETNQPLPPPRISVEQDLTGGSTSPVVKSVELLITKAVKDRASDIHIEPQADKIRIRYRIDGVLHLLASIDMGVHSALVSRIKVMAGMNIAEKRRPQDGQFSARVDNRSIDFRVATALTILGEKVVIRILDKTAGATDLKAVGFSSQLLEDFRRMLNSSFGMILVSGPTGSGKTTTLYAGLGELDPEAKNISTIEDPVEYHFSKINQIQVNPQADITFAHGLRALMRMDPDVILVGEIRDQETANIAVQAALTGHLVLSSIHANDAVGAIVRLIDLGVEPFLVTSAVIATLSQRLVRKVCPYCRALGAISPTESMAYREELQEVRNDFYQGKGCNFCSHTGFLGRTAVIEMLPISDQIRQLINRRATAAEIKTQALREGMVIMRRDGMIKARDGITTPMEIVRNVFTVG